MDAISKHAKTTKHITTDSEFLIKMRISF